MAKLTDGQKAMQRLSDRIHGGYHKRNAVELCDRTYDAEWVEVSGCSVMQVVFHKPRDSSFTALLRDSLYYYPILVSGHYRKSGRNAELLNEHDYDKAGALLNVASTTPKYQVTVRGIYSAYRGIEINEIDFVHEDRGPETVILRPKEFFEPR